VREAEVAADLLAETFAVAYERRGTFRDIGKPGEAWLTGSRGVSSRTTSAVEKA
jgi:hypothetical protein